MKKILIGIISLVLFSGIGLLLAANQGYFGYGVSSTGLLAKLNQSAGSAAAISTSVSKIEEWRVCETVTSTSASGIFVPTKTATERSTFIANKPSHITLGTCGCTTDADCDVGNICSGGTCTPQICGNGILDDGEACDLSAPNGDTCSWTPDLQQTCDSSCHCETDCVGYREPGGQRVQCAM